MKVSIDKDSGTMTIVLAVSPRPSKSGKTILVASSGGNQTFSDVEFDGKPVTVGVNAYAPK